MAAAIRRAGAETVRATPKELAGTYLALRLALVLGAVMILQACEVAERLDLSLPRLGAPKAPPEPLYMQLRDDDIRLADLTVQRALETALSGATRSWRSAVTGNSGMVTPKRTYRTKSGTFCRTYTEVVVIGNKSELYGDTACRDRNGIWNPIE